MNPPDLTNLKLPQSSTFERSLAKVVRVLKRSSALPLRRHRKRALRKAYLIGQQNEARNLPDEEPDARILETGELLRRDVLNTYRGKYEESNFRVLMLRPGSITAEIWFGGLHQCMDHAGIDCCVLPPTAGPVEINRAIDAFQPNVLIATDSTATLQSLDLEYVQAYKRGHGCLRLFVPVWHSGMRGNFSTPREDEWRWNLRRRGLTADAYFSIFEPEFYERFVRDRAGPAIDFITVPQACNPFTDHPHPEKKTYDYFMAASLTDDRLEVSYKFVRPIMRSYRGLWAGPHWGFGLQHIPPNEMSICYSRTRIALSPLVGFVLLYPAELTHRVYAAAGCGAFQLTMPTAITSRYFEPDELVQAESPEQYSKLFKHFVDQADERNEIALRAMRRTYTEHTCFHRIDQLVAYWRDLEKRGFF